MEDLNDLPLLLGPRPGGEICHWHISPPGEAKFKIV
jgi:hypothetical protein